MTEKKRKLHSICKVRICKVSIGLIAITKSLTSREHFQSHQTLVSSHFFGFGLRLYILVNNFSVCQDIFLG